jgi:NTE family protein
MHQTRPAILLALTLTAVVAVIATPLAGAAGPDGERPRIGLALSGGGARGAAHVGVLKVLEEMRIPIDCIAGTSMGSIIGGLYASGMTPGEIETALATMDWEHIFNDDPPRQDRSFRRKRDDDTYLVKTKVGVGEGKLKFPTGAIQGQKFDLALRELSLPVSTVTDFDRLHVPFRAVASDIGAGERVVLGSGDLATAMRASMAVPGAFAAAQIDGRLLVDGGITDNLPIDVVRNMCADIVIAVDISTPYKPATEINDMFAITAQLSSILTRTNAERQIATLTGRDILLVPDITGVSSSDFGRATEAVPAGQRAAEEKRGQLARLSLSPEAYADHLAARSARPPQQAPTVHFIHIRNDSTVSDAMISERLHQPIGAPLDRQQLERDIAQIYGLELFQTVQYDVVEEEGKTGLMVDARKRSWGPDYLQFGLEMASDEQGNSNYNFGVALLRTGINSLNGELRFALQLGAEPFIFGEWYQPLDPMSRWFVNTGMRYGARNINLYDDGRRLAEFQSLGTEFDFAAGREFSVFGAWRLGYRYRTGEVDLQTGTPGWPEFSFDTAQVYGRIDVDRLDNFNFPEQGWNGSFEYATARKDVGGDTDFDQVRFRATRFTSFGNGNVLGLGTSIQATVEGSAPVQERFRAGGLMNLSGYAENSLSGQQEATVAAVYYRRFKPLPILKWYIGGSLEYGGVWEDKNDIGRDGIAAGSLFLGADTTLGPIYLGLGMAESGQHAAFFYLGRPLFRKR